MIQDNYEGEISYVTFTDDEGNERFFVEDTFVSFDNKKFAILVSVDGCDDPECDCNQEPEVIIARIDEEDGEEVFVSPTDEEYERVLDMCADDNY